MAIQIRLLASLAALVLLALAGGGGCGGESDKTCGPCSVDPTPWDYEREALQIGVRTALPPGIPAGSRCEATDPHLDVASDCSTALGSRLGQRHLTVTAADGRRYSPALRIVPQRQWAALSGDAGSSGSTVLVASRGRALGWGTNGSGLLGRNSTDVNAVQLVAEPVMSYDQVPLETVAQVAQGSVSALALVNHKVDRYFLEGAVWSWGAQANSASTLPGAGLQLTAVPVQRSADPTDRLAGAVRAAAAGDALAAVLDDGSVLGWGFHPGSGPGGVQVQFPRPVMTETGAALTDILTVEGGSNSIVALGADGRVWVWGFGMAPDEGVQHQARTIKTAGGAELTGIVSISAGSHFLLALDERGQVHAAGRNDLAQLGQGDTTAVPRWIAVPVLNPEGSGPLADIIMVAAGGAVSLALDRAGQVWSWGSANVAAIGCGVSRCNRRADVQALPGPVVDEAGVGQLANVVSIAAGHGHSLALKASGEVLIWGSAGAGLGQLTADAPESFHPVPVKGSFGIDVLRLDPAGYPNLTGRFR